MKTEAIKGLIKQWDSMTYTVLNLKNIQKEEMQVLLKSTYSLLTDFHKSDLIPKDLSKLIFTIQEFIYFAELMEKNELSEGFYYCPRISLIISAMTKGFFNGEYKSEFPRLSVVTFKNEETVVNFEEDIFE